jgi:hypothetical protein
MAVVADGASYFQRSESRVHDKCPNNVSWKVRWLGSVGKLIGLAGLEHAKKINGAA